MKPAMCALLQLPRCSHTIDTLYPDWNHLLEVTHTLGAGSGRGCVCVCVCMHVLLVPVQATRGGYAGDTRGEFST